MDKKEPKFQGLHTMLPKEVHEELTEIAKGYATFSGSWDYGIVIRELLFIRKNFITVHTRLDEQELLINELNQKILNIKPIEKEKKKVKEINPDGLLGKNIMESEKDGKDRK